MSRVQVRCGELPALQTVQARRAIREKELGSDMITTIGNKHTQVLWQSESECGMPEPPIIVTNYAGSNLIDLTQGSNTVDVNYESIPELIKVMKTVKGMHD